MTVRELMIYAQKHDALDYNIVIYDENKDEIARDLTTGLCFIEDGFSEIWLG